MQIEVHANGVERRDKPAEITLEPNLPVARVQEVDDAGMILDSSVPFQQIRDTLVILLRGATPPDAARRFRVGLGSERTAVDPVVMLIWSTI